VDAHPTDIEPGLEIVRQSMRVKKAEAGHCTHLAVNFGPDAEIDHGKNYSRKAGQARSGVDLSKGRIQTTSK